MTEYYIGVDIGGTSIKMGLFSHVGELLEKWNIPTDVSNAGANILNDIVNSIEEKREKLKANIKGIGLGVPGPMTEDGTVLKCSNLGWGVFNVKNAVADLTGVGNVKVGNDANLAGLGELWKGGGRGYDSIVMITLGTGCGGAVILNGKVLTGYKGTAGEIGHIKVERDETETCGCGKKGCLEQYVSGPGIVRMAKKNMQKDSCLFNLQEFTAKDIFDGAKENDKYCLELVDKFGRYLGQALSDVAHIVSPEAFVIGGGLSAAGDILLDPVKKYYKETAMFSAEDREFKLAELGNDAGIYGAVRTVIFP